jgi:hypothetical protein
MAVHGIGSAKYARMRSPEQLTLAFAPKSMVSFADTA